MGEARNQYSEIVAEASSGWDYMSILWQQRYVLSAAIVFFLVVALIVRLVMPAQYEGNVGMVPITSDTQISNVVGTLANLGLLNGSDGNSQRYVALATLRSRDFLQRFIVKQNLMPTLFPSKWNAVERQWIGSKPPTLEKGYEKLFGAMSIVTSTTDPIIRLRVRWEDPVIAASLANNLIKALNQELQHNAMQEAERMVTAFTAAYRETTIQELHANIANLIEGQLHQRIMIQSRPEYAMQVVDPALPSNERVNPGLAILLPVGLMLGLLFGVPAAFLRHVWKTKGGLPVTPSSHEDGARWRFSFSR